MVGSSGLEPPTSRLSGARSNLLSYEPILVGQPFSRSCLTFGGDDGVRTHDPLLAGQVLSQLSYTPIRGSFAVLNRTTKKVVPEISSFGLFSLQELYRQLWDFSHSVLAAIFIAAGSP